MHPSLAAASRPRPTGVPHAGAEGQDSGCGLPTPTGVASALRSPSSCCQPRGCFPTPIRSYLLRTGLHSRARTGSSRPTPGSWAPHAGQVGTHLSHPAMALPGGPGGRGGSEASCSDRGGAEARTRGGSRLLASIPAESWPAVTVLWPLSCQQTWVDGDRLSSWGLPSPTQHGRSQPGKAFFLRFSLFSSTATPKKRNCSEMI